MLDKNTFGNTPAALYLANRLNQLNNKKFSRKIGNVIRNFRTTLFELFEAKRAGNISTHTFSSMVEILNERVDRVAYNMLHCPSTEYDSIDLPDVLAVTLMLNVIKGDLKSMGRRSRKTRLLEKAQVQALGKIVENKKPVHNKEGVTIGYEITKFEPSKIDIKYVDDGVTAYRLQMKSRKKLARAGKKCELY